MVKKGITGMARDLGVIFLGIPNCAICEFWKKNYFLI